MYRSSDKYRQTLYVARGYCNANFANHWFVISWLAIGTELSVFLPFSHVPVQRALMVICTVGARRAQMLDNAAGPLLASGAGVAQLPQFLTE